MPGGMRRYLQIPAGEPMQSERELPDDAIVVRDDSQDPERFRRLYQDVGGEYVWIDRLPWTEEQWRTHVTRLDVEMWVLLVGGERAGYFELRFEPDGLSVEIAYFGLLPAFVGRGLGAPLLTAAVRAARARADLRVWLHTSTRDHAHALANYEARGFHVFHTEVL